MPEYSATHAYFGLSPLDGRYAKKVDPLRGELTEFGLMKYRVFVEIKWLIWLSKQPEIVELPAFDSETEAALMTIVDKFDAAAATRIKAIEARTNHDVKAVEYYIKECVESMPAVQPYNEFIHFGCTSEDINNLSYALMLKAGRDTFLLPELRKLSQTLTALSEEYAASPLLARTHGQPATPTTMGKELKNYCVRLSRQLKHFESVAILGKFNGAVGNYNAHYIAYPEVNWPQVNEDFVRHLGLGFNSHTAQIEPHDFIAEYCHAISRLNTILIDFSADIWGYISHGVFRLRMNENEVGSSTMPHKVNPIDFENAEGNLTLAQALCTFFANRLPVSRFQRDLIDSTLLRNLSVAIAHSYLAYKTLQKGVSKIALDKSGCVVELGRNWAVLAEALQTVMRRYGLDAPYERLKDLTRGQHLTSSDYKAFVDGLELPDAVKAELRALTPETYLGYAERLAKA